MLRLWVWVSLELRGKVMVILISKDCNCHWHPFGLLSRCGNVRPDLWDYAEGLKIAPLWWPQPAARLQKNVTEKTERKRGENWSAFLKTKINRGRSGVWFSGRKKTQAETSWKGRKGRGGVGESYKRKVCVLTGPLPLSVLLQQMSQREERGRST